MSRASFKTTDIAHLIQVALTPIFLISAIGVTLNVLTSRLARIVDRARAMENELCDPNFQPDGRDRHAALAVLERRADWINAAITMITISALFIALVVVMLFVNAFVHWELAAFIAVMFILSMLSLCGAFMAFLIEVRIATTTLRIGIEAARVSERRVRAPEGARCKDRFCRPASERKTPGDCGATRSTR